MISGSIYGWLTVYSVFIELADLTKLEDLAHLRVSKRLLKYFSHACGLFYATLMGKKYKILK